jgi:hypothetical protein
MHREQAYAGLLSQARNADCIARGAIRPGPDLEGDRNLDCANDCVEDCGYQRFVGEQRRTGSDVAHFLGRAAHVDVDDLRAKRNVVARGIGHRRRIGPRDLHRDRIDFAGVIRSQPGFARLAQLRLRGHHLGHRHARTEALAELPERPVGHTCHRSNEQSIAQSVRAKLHRLEVWFWTMRGKRILYAPARKKNLADDICIVAATSQRTKEAHLKKAAERREKTRG